MFCFGLMGELMEEIPGVANMTNRSRLFYLDSTLSAK